MFVLLLFLSLLQQPSFSPVAAAPCDCPAATGLQKTGQTGSSLTIAWNSEYAGAQFRVWYVRQEDNAFSGYYYTSSAAYQFTGLTAGHYTFYVQVLCGGSESGFIGIEDTISA